MTARNRGTLKKFFKSGEMPRAGHFADLIDSMVNLIDDGIESGKEYGLKITPYEDKGHLISFFDKDNASKPSWSFVMDRFNNILSIENVEKETVFSAKTIQDKKNGSRKNYVGIGTDNPVRELDVSGVVNMTGRRGTFTSENIEHNGVLCVPADKKWHKVLTNLKGCRMFEIVAGVGEKGTGKYALLHAIAMNCHNGKQKKIKKVHATFFWPWDKLGMGWTGITNNYYLEFETRREYGSDVYIKVSISELWHDPLFISKDNDEIKLDG
mgnify:FL=1